MARPIKMTLCWKCAKACGACSWSDKLIPVKGWTAKKTRLQNADGYGSYRYSTSYQVIECPEFVDDTDQYNKRLAPSKDSGWHPNSVAREVMSRHIQYPEVVVSTNKSDARKRIEALPKNELINRIETRLSGIEKDVAKMTLIGKMRACDIADVIFYSEWVVKRMLRVIWKKLDT